MIATGQSIHCTERSFFAGTGMMYRESDVVFAGLAPEAQRSLRSMTDMAFDGKSEQLLTVYPLPVHSKQAFIRSWPAEGWVRPGSVWSHVLLVDFIDVGMLPDLSQLEDLFQRQSFTEPELGAEELARYSSRLEIERPRRIRPAQVDRRLAVELLFRLYSSDDPVRVS